MTVTKRRSCSKREPGFCAASHCRCAPPGLAVLFPMTEGIHIATFRFRGVAAVVVVVVATVAAFVYNGHRRGTLHAQGREQVEEYLRSELPARRFRERGAKASVEEIRRQKDFEIVEFSAPFVPGDKTRVWVVVRTPDEELEYCFRFRRSLGAWRLDGESAGGLFR